MKTNELTLDEIRFLLFAIETTESNVKLDDRESTIATALSAKLGPLAA